MNTTVYVTEEPSGNFSPQCVVLPPLKNDEVLVRVDTVGLTSYDTVMWDLHPGMIGRQGYGTVLECGDGCRFIKKGDVVAFGPVFDCCGSCEYCISQEPQFCKHHKNYFNGSGDTGYMRTAFQCKEILLTKTKDQVYAAMGCVLAPFIARINACKGDAVVGLISGCPILKSVMSSVLTKMGIKYVDTSVEEYKFYFDIVFDFTSNDSINPRCLKAMGEYHKIPSTRPTVISPMQLVQGKSIHGPVTGSPKYIAAMLDLVTRLGITYEGPVKTFPVTRVEDALLYARETGSLVLVPMRETNSWYRCVKPMRETDA